MCYCANLGERFQMRFVKQIEIHAEERSYLVSTVELPVTEEVLQFLPYRYETMVFRLDPNGDFDGNELDVAKYETLEEAITGHEKMLGKWAKKFKNVMTKER